MADASKLTDRDQTLINILRRMADQIQKQDKLLDDVSKDISAIILASDNTDYRRKSQDKLLEKVSKDISLLIQASDSAEHRRGTKVGDDDVALDKILQSISRYRSDMLSLVNEQDRITKSLKELDSVIRKAAYSIAEATQILAELDTRSTKQEKSLSEHIEHTLKQAEIFTDERLKKQEKTIQDHYAHALKLSEVFTDERLVRSEKAIHDHLAHSLKQAELIPQEFAETNRTVTRLHADTEKSIGKLHDETQRQMEKTQSEMLRRLVTLDSLESALQTLLIRTEPPEKKPFIIKRLFIKLRSFFRVTVVNYFK